MYSHNWEFTYAKSKRQEESGFCKAHRFGYISWVAIDLRYYTRTLPLSSELCWTWVDLIDQIKVSFAYYLRACTNFHIDHKTNTNDFRVKARRCSMYGPYTYIISTSPTNIIFVFILSILGLSIQYAFLCQGKNKNIMLSGSESLQLNVYFASKDTQSVYWNPNII